MNFVMVRNCFAVFGAYDDFGTHYMGPLSFHDNEASARIELGRLKRTGARTIDVIDPPQRTIEDAAGGTQGSVYWIGHDVITIFDLTKERSASVNLTKEKST